jgi:hypothetical protein
MQTTPIVTDVVRYVSEEVTVPEQLPTDASNPSRRLAAAELERTLRERMELLAEANREVTLVIDFTLESQWLTPATAATLPLPAIVGVLRGEFGYRSPTLWLDRVRLPAPPPIAESWFEQETLLGDFLRAARQLGSAEKTINHDHYLPEGAWRQPMRDIARFQEPAIVQAALAEAASLGMGLLFPEEVR